MSQDPSSFVKVTIFQNGDHKSGTVRVMSLVFPLCPSQLQTEANFDDHCNPLFQCLHP